MTVITLTYTKKEIFDLVNNRTIYLSDPLGSKEELRVKRIADVIPLSQDDYDFFTTALYSAAKRVFTKLAYNVTDIEDPYTISGDGDIPENSIIYKFNLYTGANELQITPMVQQAVAEALINYILSEWLIVKSYSDHGMLYKAKFEESLTDIKSALQYGQTATTKYRTL